MQVDGEDVTAAIREAEIDRLVPTVARHPEVREVMRERQRVARGRRRLGHRGARHRQRRRPGRRVEGVSRSLTPRSVRDDAAPSGPASEVDALAADLRARDERDAVNTRPADDAVLLDTTALTIDEVVDRIVELVEARR